jgi:hypothetical protein
MDIKGRPDKINRNTPSPDYVCEEQKTKARLSIEITMPLLYLKAESLR